MGRSNSKDLNALNRVKNKEVEQLTDYLQLLTYKQRVRFVTKVCALAGIQRYIFHNWKSERSKIYDYVKPIMEQVAGQRIFSDNTI